MDTSKFNDKKEWRKFGIGVAVILAVIATIQLIVGKELFIYFYGVAAFFLFFGLLLPIIIKPVYILFSYLGLILGWFMTRVILSILFYIIFTPIGLILRLFGKNFLDLKIDKKAETYWLDKKIETINKIHFERQF
ncbi:MAG: hypothetical protein KAJ10_16680, partial [Thermodesulfovibrionia bacterium]|nr:hypothetical protein [Thermodesulfovibrionia bacterium]